MIKLDLASTDLHFRQILDLQRLNHAGALSPDVQAHEGFVYAQHTASLLRRMSAELPQAVALADHMVVGYCLSLPLSLRSELPTIAPMFDQFARSAYRGRSLSELSFFVGGQVCVDRAYRGRGLIGRLYEHVRRSAPAEYELCVTEIAIRNQVSVRAHKRIGFEEISKYSDGREEWVIVAWPLRRPALSQ
jgi:GNAT superfamily N-acetyltransferase